MPIQWQKCIQVIIRRKRTGGSSTARQCIVDVCSNIPASAADLLEIVLREVTHHEHDIEREVASP